MKATGVSALLRQDLLEAEEYVPIVPLEVLSEQVGIPMERLIKLDGNENPYGCSPRVNRALQAFAWLHIYPDPGHSELRRRLASYVGLDAGHIIAGNGSDELIDLVLRLVLAPGDGVVNCVPTFGMYSFNTAICGGRVIEVPRTADFAIDARAVKQAIDARSKLIFVASPNNPTANLTPRETIIELLDTGLIVFVDEAYYEFAGGATVADLVPHYDNLIVARTFSKWAGLAGLRVGYGIVPKPIVKHLWKIKPPYNVNAAAQVAAVEALADLEFRDRTVKAILAERDNLMAGLTALDFLQPCPTDANFIFCYVRRGSARAIKEELDKQGIFIRYFDKPLLRNALRISVGKPEHTAALLDALTKIGRELE
ncbi:MAG: histidinol-phosphate transaminase [Chloroflexi bacterium]|nr:histidinol-phosphate transaminase [Chloroflexota bacterium]